MIFGPGGNRTPASTMRMWRNATLLRAHINLISLIGPIRLISLISRISLIYPIGIMKITLLKLSPKTTYDFFFLLFFSFPIKIFRIPAFFNKFFL